MDETLGISRAQAIRAGHLIDMTNAGLVMGLRVPSAISLPCWTMLTNGNDDLETGVRSQVMRALASAFIAETRMRERIEDDRVSFVVEKTWFEGIEPRPLSRFATILGHIGPGDDTKPVLTFKLLDEG